VVLWGDSAPPDPTGVQAAPRLALRV